jgi:hypothetical protein
MCQDRTSDLVASVYSITSSARSKIEVGTPTARNPSRGAPMRVTIAAATPGYKKPMSGILGGCARAVSGQAAPLPNNVMKSRRLAGLSQADENGLG